jgi:hypothetical protein
LALLASFSAGAAGVEKIKVLCSGAMRGAAAARPQTQVFQI